ncbi:hypothetical protein SS50377_24931 [Spironucleus salmonicida]|uniref:Uncharacterized protein n=1 Tax=Spironucleus salmonicida TaxID=348837 RepID=V6LG22_9EUKA|nr:hypothetical protein SS50377_24931 [Spironucleus salmonicida]|eukprot:EST43462.1 Hypothetical protein SS50377_16826 [Spironucleus salmonicida]
MHFSKLLNQAPPCAADLQAQNRALRSQLKLSALQPQLALEAAKYAYTTRLLSQRNLRPVGPKRADVGPALCALQELRGELAALKAFVLEAHDGAKKTLIFAFSGLVRRANSGVIAQERQEWAFDAQCRAQFFERQNSALTKQLEAQNAQMQKFRETQPDSTLLQNVQSLQTQNQQLLQSEKVLKSQVANVQSEIEKLIFLQAEYANRYEEKTVENEELLNRTNALARQLVIMELRARNSAKNCSLSGLIPDIGAQIQSKSEGYALKIAHNEAELRTLQTENKQLSEANAELQETVNKIRHKSKFLSEKFTQIEIFPSKDQIRPAESAQKTTQEVVIKQFDECENSLYQQLNTQCEKEVELLEQERLNAAQEHLAITEENAKFALKQTKLELEKLQQLSLYHVQLIENQGQEIEGLVEQNGQNQDELSRIKRQNDDFEVIQQDSKKIILDLSQKVAEAQERNRQLAEQNKDVVSQQQKQLKEAYAVKILCKEKDQNEQQCLKRVGQLEYALETLETQFSELNHQFQEQNGKLTSATDEMRVLTAEKDILSSQNNDASRIIKQLKIDKQRQVEECKQAHSNKFCQFAQQVNSCLGQLDQQSQLNDNQLEKLEFQISTLDQFNYKIDFNGILSDIKSEVVNNSLLLHQKVQTLSYLTSQYEQNETKQEELIQILQEQIGM